MFSVSSLEAVENPTNRSNVGVAVFVTDPNKIKSDDYKVIYNEKDDLWTLSASTLKNSVTGKKQLKQMDSNYPFFGRPLDGDEFSIVPTSASKGMNFLLTRPQDIAAAATSLVSSSSSNTGASKLEEIALIKQEDKTTIQNIDSVFLMD